MFQARPHAVVVPTPREVEARIERRGVGPDLVALIDRHTPRERHGAFQVGEQQFRPWRAVPRARRLGETGNRGVAALFDDDVEGYVLFAARIVTLQGDRCSTGERE
jgi:hypothetical protein